MKKILSIIFLSIVLVSCAKQEPYYFEDVTDKMSLPPIEWARTFEILIKKDCGEKEQFNTTTNQLEKVSFLCEATINKHRFFRVMKEDRRYEFYELIDFWDTASGDWEWRLSNNTF